MRKDDNKQYVLLLPIENIKATFYFIPTREKNPNYMAQSYKKVVIER